MTSSNQIRVLHLCHSDDRGGAAIGARRLHLSMLAEGVDSRLVVVTKYSDDPTVIEMPKRPIRRRLAQILTRNIVRLQHSENRVIRTLNVVPMGTAEFLNSIDADVVQLHWVGADTIGISEIAKLNKPIVWKMPDMWAFSGAEHYINPGDPERFREGYKRSNRPYHESGLDLDRLVWRYKRRQWRDVDFNIVGPSRWIAECAQTSALFRGSRVRHIPNPLNVNVYKPTSMVDARKRFGLPEDQKLVMFGAMHATKDRRKGFHHLENALVRLSGEMGSDDVAFVILGADGPRDQKIGGFDVHYLGIIRDEMKLVDAYNVADAFVLPAEADNLPNVVKEATCCGVPCVGFDVGGMRDMVEHRVTGYLAAPYDADDLAKGISWIVKAGSQRLRENVRRRAVEMHAPEVAVSRYMDFYRQILSGGQV